MMTTRPCLRSWWMLAPALLLVGGMARAGTLTVSCPPGVTLKACAAMKAAATAKFQPVLDSLNVEEARLEIRREHVLVSCRMNQQLSQTLSLATANFSWSDTGWTYSGNANPGAQQALNDLNGKMVAARAAFATQMNNSGTRLDFIFEAALQLRLDGPGGVGGGRFFGTGPAPAEAGQGE